MFLKRKNDDILSYNLSLNKYNSPSKNGFIKGISMISCVNFHGWYI